VTPLGIQEGAAKIAVAEKIQSVRLDPDSTQSDYLLKFLEKTMIGASVKLSAVMGINLSAEVLRFCTHCGKKFIVQHNEQHCEDCSVTTL